MIRSRTREFLALGIWASASMLASGAITFVGSSGDRSAQATFTDLGGGNLEIKLVNTYTGDTVDQSHVLTAIFFSGASGLTPVSAVAPTGSLLWNFHTSSAAPSSSVLGQQWEYLAGLSGAPGGATAGISSSGLGLFGLGNFASGGVMVDGSAYGLLSGGYAGSALDGLDHRDFIQNSMIFTLSGFTGTLCNISQVTFQYGTTTTEPSLAAGAPAIPEANFAGASMALILPALGLMLVRKNKRMSTSS